MGRGLAREEYQYLERPYRDWLPHRRVLGSWVTPPADDSSLVAKGLVIANGPVTPGTLTINGLTLLLPCPSKSRSQGRYADLSGTIRGLREIHHPAASTVNQRIVI